MHPMKELNINEDFTGLTGRSYPRLQCSRYQILGPIIQTLTPYVSQGVFELKLFRELCFKIFYSIVKIILEGILNGRSERGFMSCKTTQCICRRKAENPSNDEEMVTTPQVGNYALTSLQSFYEKAEVEFFTLFQVVNDFVY